MPFSSDRTRRAWDAGAEAWEEFVESGADYYRTEVHGPALLDVCGEIEESDQPTVSTLDGSLNDMTPPFTGSTNPHGKNSTQSTMIMRPGMHRWRHRTKCRSGAV